MARLKISKKERIERFLAAYAQTCNIVASAKLAGIGRRDHYRWLGENPEYAALFKETQHLAAEFLECELIQRATKGWLDPIFYQGKRCGAVRRYDGSTGMALLRGLMPERYGIQRQEISGPQGQPMQAKITVVYVDPHDSDSSESGNHG